MSILTSNSDQGNSNLYGYYLPKGLLKLTIKGVDRTVTGMDISPEIVADRSHRLFLSYSPSVFASDTLDISFSAKGFLKQVSTVRKDEGVQIINAVIESVSALATGQVDAAARGLSPGAAGEPKVLYVETFDPFSAEALETVNKDLAQLKCKFYISPIAKEEIGNKQPTASKPGIWARPQAPFDCHLKLDSGEYLQGIIHLPDPGQLQYVEIPEARWVETKFSMEFDDMGFPLKVHIEKPSEALAVAKVPLKILGAILDLPAKLFSLRVNIDNQKKEREDYKTKKQTEQEAKE